MKIGLLFAALFLILGCDQDPLKNAPESVKRNTPPQTEKPRAPQAFPKEAMPIYAPSVVSAYVGGTVIIEISGNVLIEDADFKLSIENLEDFPGAQYDVVQGHFIWTPQKSLLGTSAFVEKTLRVALNLNPGSNNVASREEKNISVIIFNTFEKPVIQSLSGPDQVIVGQSYTYQFSVFDSEAGSGKNINIQPWDCSDNFNKSISSMIKVKDTFRTDPATPGLYYGEFVLDLSKAQGLSRNRHCVGLIAMSKQGKMSTLSMKSLSVEPPIRHTVMSMDRTPVLPLNQTTHFYFTIYDPSGLGTVTLTSADDVSAKLPGSYLSCDSRPWSQYQLQCEAVILTHTAKVGRYYFHLKVRNSAAHIKMEFNDTHTMYVDVK